MTKSKHPSHAWNYHVHEQALRLIRKFGYDVRSESNAPFVLAEFLMKSADSQASEYALAIYRALEGLTNRTSEFLEELELLLIQLDPSTLEKNVNKSPLPRAPTPSPVPTEEAVLEKEPQPKSRQTMLAPQVLVVEDNAMNRMLIDRVLTEEGYRVHVAESGEAALEMAEQENFSLILMDISLPGIDGFETAQKIKEDLRYEAVPIVALTAHSKNEVFSRANEVGMVDYIAKPVDRKRLLRTIKKLTGECS